MKDNYRIIVLVFLVSVASGFFWNHKIFGKPIDSDQIIYDGIASDILVERTYTYGGEETYVEPAYPLFLAGIYGIFGDKNHDVVRIVQIFLFAVTVCIVFLIAKPLIGLAPAFISAIAAALYFPLVNQSGVLTQEILFTFLVACLVYLMYRTRDGKSVWWFLAGAALGLASLTKGSMQFFFVFVIAYVFFKYWKAIPLGKIFLKVAVFMLGFMVIMGPWLVREKLSGGEYGVAPRGGMQLLALAEVTEKMSQNYLGNFIGFSFGYYFSQKLYPEIDSAAFRDTSLSNQRRDGLLEQGHGFRETDAIMFEEAKDYFIKNPHKYIYMSVLNFINFNSPILIKGPLWQNVTAIHPMFADGRHPEMPSLLKAFVALGVRMPWFLLFFLVIYGMWVNRNDLKKFEWMLLLIFYLTIFYSLVWSIPRYALPIYPYYFILSATGFIALWNKIWQERLSKRFPH